MQCRFDGDPIVRVLSLHGLVHASVHFSTVFHDLSVGNKGCVMITHDKVNLPGEFQFQTHGIQQDSVGEAPIVTVLRPSMNDFLEEDMTGGMLG